MNTCLMTLVLFMSAKAGIPFQQQGWVIHDKNVPFYTWYESKHPNIDSTKNIEYLAVALSINDLQNKSLKPIGKCSEADRIYTVFGLQGRIKE